MGENPRGSEWLRSERRSWKGGKRRNWAPPHTIDTCISKIDAEIHVLHDAYQGAAPVSGLANRLGLDYDDPLLETLLYRFVKRCVELEMDGQAALSRLLGKHVRHEIWEELSQVCVIMVDDPLWNRLSEIATRSEERFVESMNAVKEEGSHVEVDSIQAIVESRPALGDSFDAEWLMNQCSNISKELKALSPDQLFFTLSDVLCSKQSDESIQAELVDTIGMDRLDLIIQLIEHRDSLKMSMIGGGKTVGNQSRVQPSRAHVDNRPVPLLASTITVTTASEKHRDKLRRKEERKMARLTRPDLELIQQLERNKREAEDPLGRFMDSSCGRGSQKSALPKGTLREQKNGYEEVIVPAVHPPKEETYAKDLIPVSSLPLSIQHIFTGMKTFNRMQSRCFHAAFKTNQNLLVCAPTGAGKTNVALLTIANELQQHFRSDGSGIDAKQEFKIVYVAPMKALCSEVTSKFSKRLAPMGVIVRELTGDMQLTRREIATSHVIVITPEKLDVITRKSDGDGAFAASIRLLIIDEVHLLHDERGSVIETLVARTIRQVEASQLMIRLVGLSATLPNYGDVAEFLRVNQNGLLVFDASYRPVPLEQRFIGVSEANVERRMHVMDEICYDKLSASLRQGNQVLIFVHSRRDTFKVAKRMLEIGAGRGESDIISLPTSHVQYDRARRDIARSNNRDLHQLFENGAAIHHAGMVRDDRTMVERMFTIGVIRFLCTTATLAWGVNLPSRTVIIRGTDIYDAQRGGFVNLSMLDVMQIFGRAGRPQYDTRGEGIIITSQEKLSHYLRLLTHQLPIESQFIKSLPDNLNAEITLGTVTNMNEALSWLSYTYLYVRMRHNPTAYGISYQELQLDPTLVSRRRTLIMDAINNLQSCKMIRFDESTQTLYAVDLGRTASYCYLHHESIAKYMTYLKPDYDQAEILHAISGSKEFEQIKINNQDIDDLEKLHGDVCMVHVKGQLTDYEGKVNVLLQAYISRARILSSSLSSDQYYISQSAGRICRALFEIVLKRGWIHLALLFLEFCKMIDRRLWNHLTPLRQFPSIHYELLMSIEQHDDWSIDRIANQLDETTIGMGLNHHRMGSVIKRYAREIPQLGIHIDIEPVTREILRLIIRLSIEFEWNVRTHGLQQPFHVWVYDEEQKLVFFAERLIIYKPKPNNDDGICVTTYIPSSHMFNFTITAISDIWLGSHAYVDVDLTSVVLPRDDPIPMICSSIRPMRISNDIMQFLSTKRCESYFHPIISQLYHPLLHSNASLLICAIHYEQRVIAVELALLQCWKQQQEEDQIVLLLTRNVDNWKQSLLYLTKCGPHLSIIIATPEKWIESYRKFNVNRLNCVFIDDIHRLESQCDMEIALCELKSCHVSRYIMFSSVTIGNAIDDISSFVQSNCLIYNFTSTPSLQLHIQPFPGDNYVPRVAAMNKPTFAAIQTYASSSSMSKVIIFVSSIVQTRKTAIELVKMKGLDIMNATDWSMISNEHLRHTLETGGIGQYHDALNRNDKDIVKTQFESGLIRIVVTSIRANVLPQQFYGDLVIVKGTESYDIHQNRYIDQHLVDIFDMMHRANHTAYILVHASKHSYYEKFLRSPLQVESALMDSMHDALNAMIVNRRVTTMKSAIQWMMKHTFLGYRLSCNPTFYKCYTNVKEFVGSIIMQTIQHLVNASMIERIQSTEKCLEMWKSTKLGRAAACNRLSWSAAQQIDMILMSSNISLSIQSIFQVICDSNQCILELPIRHSDAYVNQQIANQCLWSIRMDDGDGDNDNDNSIHIKQSILLQARMQRLHLNQVYINDQCIALDIAKRIIETIIQIGTLDVQLMSMHLHQLLVRAIVYGSNPIVQITDRIDLQSHYTLPQLVHNHSQLLNDNVRDAIEIKRQLSMIPILHVTFQPLSIESLHVHDAFALSINCLSVCQSRSRIHCESWWFVVSALQVHNDDDVDDNVDDGNNDNSISIGLGWYNRYDHTNHDHVHMDIKCIAPPCIGVYRLQLHIVAKFSIKPLCAEDNGNVEYMMSACFTDHVVALSPDFIDSILASHFQQPLYKGWATVKYDQDDLKDKIVVVSPLRVYFIKDGALGKSITMEYSILSLMSIHTIPDNEFEVNLLFQGELNNLTIITPQCIAIVHALMFASACVTHGVPSAYLPIMSISQLFLNAYSPPVCSNEDGFIARFLARCNYLGMPPHADVVDFILSSFQTQTKQFNLSECISTLDKIPEVNVIALFNALRYSRCFTELVIQGVTMNRRMFIALGHIFEVNSSIKSLILRNTKLNKKYAKLLAESLAMGKHQLNTLEIGNDSLGDKGIICIIDAIKHGRPIVNIAFDHLGLSGVGISYIIHSIMECKSWNSTLASLNLSGNKFGKQCSNLLIEWIQQQQLVLQQQKQDSAFNLHQIILNQLIGRNANSDISRILQSIQQAPLLYQQSLCRLDISGNRLTKIAVSTIANLFEQTCSLSNVNVSRCSLQQTSLCQIFSSLSRNVHKIAFSLDVSHNDAGLGIVKALAGAFENGNHACECLKELNIGYMGIGIDGFLPLCSQLKRMTRLRALTLDGNVQKSGKGTLLFGNPSESLRVGYAIADLLMHANVAIHTLTIRGNDELGLHLKHGIIPLLQCLADHCDDIKLRHLDLSGNRFAHESHVALGNMVMRNSRIHTLVVDRNKWTPDRLRDFMKSLSVNCCIYNETCIPLDDVDDFLSRMKNVGLFKIEEMRTIIMQMEQFLERNKQRIEIKNSNVERYDDVEHTREKPFSESVCMPMKHSRRSSRYLNILSVQVANNGSVSHVEQSQRGSSSATGERVSIRKISEDDIQSIEIYDKQRQSVTLGRIVHDTTKRNSIV